MTNETFEFLLNRRISGIKETLSSKAKEYSSAKDRLYNFKRAATILETSPEKALLGMFVKHLVSVLDIVEQSSNGETPNTKIIDEKIGDTINYLILLEAIFKEKHLILAFEERTPR